MKKAQAIAKKYGLILFRSYRKDKKYYIIHPVTGKAVHFGSKGMSDYLTHNDKDRRDRYYARHGNIYVLRNGRKVKAINIKYSPAWLSARILWPID